MDEPNDFLAYFPTRSWCSRCRTPVGHLPDGWACPRCGTLGRLVSVELMDDDTFQSFFGEEEARLVIAAPMLVGASIVLGRRTIDGSVVESVAPVWFEYVKRLKADPNFAYEITPAGWEEMIAAAYQNAGYDEVILTPRSGDLGRDVIAIKKDFATVRIVNQMKRYRADRIVTAEEVRALYGVMRLDGANKAVLTTTAEFAPKLLEDRLLRLAIPVEMELIDRHGLIPKLVDIAGRSGNAKGRKNGP